MCTSIFQFRCRLNPKKGWCFFRHPLPSMKAPPKGRIQVGNSTIKIVPFNISLPPAYQRHRCRGPYLRFWGGSSGGFRSRGYSLKQMALTNFISSFKTQMHKKSYLVVVVLVVEIDVCPILSQDFICFGQ